MTVVVLLLCDMHMLLRANVVALMRAVVTTTMQVLLLMQLLLVLMLLNVDVVLLLLLQVIVLVLVWVLQLQLAVCLQVLQVVVVLVHACTTIAGCITCLLLDGGRVRRRFRAAALLLHRTARTRHLHVAVRLQRQMPVGRVVDDRACETRAWTRK